MARGKQEDNSPAGNAARASIERQQREHRRRNRGTSESADWANADAARIASAICAVTKHGFAIRFGYTRDGGSFAIGVVGDGEPYTDFVRPTEDVDVYLDSLREDYAGAS